MTPQIDGYEILQPLARGGMGRVYLARARGPGGFERHVVIKTLDVASKEDDPRAKMFLDEARVIGRMHHQHIAPAFSVGRDREGHFYLVMDYIHGRSAAEAWDRTLDLDAMLPLDYAVTVTLAAASALHYAHTRTSRDGVSLSIVHRDVSLSNLMIGYDGAVKLIDFGIAKSTESSTETQIGFVKGKVGYLAPEQASGGRIDHRTDIFALGIVLYELSTMSRAFREESELATLERIKKCQYVPPSEVIDEFPRPLEAIIAKALQRDPAQRFQDAEAMRRELENFGLRHQLVLGQSAIVEVMAQLFSDRAEPWLLGDGTVRDIDDSATVPIDTTIDRTPPPRAGGTALRALRAASDVIPLTVRKTPRTDETPTTLMASPPAVAFTPSAGTPEPPRRRLWLVLIPIGVIAALVGWIGTTWWRQSAAAPPADAAIVAVPIDAMPPADAAVDAAVPDAATMVHIRINTIPADATVLLDGERLGRTPLDLVLPISDQKRTFKIRKQGYVTRKLEVSLTSDVTQELTLERGP